MKTREQFYKSKQWEAFRKVIIEQRIDADGYVHCCECGKPILQKYDLIIHHKQELSEANVNDVMVALNPDNVECICFKCHNKIHERFTEGHGATAKPVRKHVYIVYGSPAAGKSTWVHSVASQYDLVVKMLQLLCGQIQKLPLRKSNALTSTAQNRKLIKKKNYTDYTVT